MPHSNIFPRKPIFGYRAVVVAIFGIGFLGLFLWGHHMFTSGMSPYSCQGSFWVSHDIMLAGQDDLADFVGAWEKLAENVEAIVALSQTSH